MAESKDNFLSQLDIEISNDQIVITKKRRRNYVALIFGLIIAPFLLFWGVLGFFQGGFVLVLIAIYAGWNTWRTNSRGLYPTTLINFPNRIITRRGAFSFIRDKVVDFDEIKDLGFGVKAVGGHTSAYEEGNTDYRKTLILETDQGDIRLCNYKSRNTDLEPSVEEFANLLREKFELDKVVK